MQAVTIPIVPVIPFVFSGLANSEQDLELVSLLDIGEFGSGALLVRLAAKGSWPASATCEIAVRNAMWADDTPGRVFVASEDMSLITVAAADSAPNLYVVGVGGGTALGRYVRIYLRWKQGANTGSATMSLGVDIQLRQAAALSVGTTLTLTDGSSGVERQGVQLDGNKIQVGDPNAETLVRGTFIETERGTVQAGVGAITVDTANYAWTEDELQYGSVEISGLTTTREQRLDLTKAGGYIVTNNAAYVLTLKRADGGGTGIEVTPGETAWVRANAGQTDVIKGPSTQALVVTPYSRPATVASGVWSFSPALDSNNTATDDPDGVYLERINTTTTENNLIMYKSLGLASAGDPFTVTIGFQSVAANAFGMAGLAIRNNASARWALCCFFTQNYDFPTKFALRELSALNTFVADRILMGATDFYASGGAGVTWLRLQRTATVYKCFISYPFDEPRS